MSSKILLLHLYCWLPRLVGGKTWHEEVQPRERNHVYCQLSQISIELTREAQAGGYPTHGGWDKVIEITVGGCGEFQGLIVDAIGLICVLNQLVDGESGIVGLNYSVWNLTVQERWIALNRDENQTMLNI